MTRRFFVFIIAFLLSACTPSVRTDRAKHMPRETRMVMGTLFEITICGGTTELFHEAFSVAEDLDRKLSNYRESSEISELNRRAFHESFKVSKDVFELIQISKSLSERTAGSFDITVGPLIKLWDKASKENRLPHHEEVAKVRAHIGFQHVAIDEEAQTIRFGRAGMYLDTGGIGKGFAVDKVIALLKKRGVECALVNFGQSSMYALGSPPQERAWRLSVQFPEDEPLGLLELKDSALSASESFGRSWEIGGKRYGRLIDPLTGTPTERRRRAVVMGPSATAAEALSKAVILQNDLRSLDKSYDYILKDERKEFPLVTSAGTGDCR